MSKPADSAHREQPEQRLPSFPRPDAVILAIALAEKAKKRTSKTNFQIINSAKQLPIWSEAVRGIPNIALRSALFGVAMKGVRGFLERKEIHAQDGISIVYTGVRLDQGDLDVWETVLHITRIQALGMECRVTAYQLLKNLRQTDTGNNRASLDKRLSRMKATGLDVKIAGILSYEGSLIDEVYRATDSREYIIRLNPKLINLFASDLYTEIDWELRQKLRGKPLAQWLHGYYSSHANPYSLKPSTLLKLAGSANNEPRSSNQKLRKALDALEEASNNHGQSFSYKIEKGLIHIDKVPSNTQKKHLAKKARKK